MKIKNHPLIGLGIIIWVLFFLATFSPAASDEEKNKPEAAPTLEEVKEKMGAAAESISGYTSAQRDQAIAKARQELEKLDGKIAMLEEKIDQEWDQLSAHTRQQWQDTLIQLRKKRIEAAEWYGGIQRGSVDAWEEIKKGYANAYAELDQSWEKAWKEFTDKSENQDSGQSK